LGFVAAGFDLRRTDTPHAEARGYNLINNPGRLPSG